MDSNKKDVIEKIYRLTLQDAEFNAALRKKLKIESSANVVLDNDEHLDEIYELCIKKIMYNQAKDFYKDFCFVDIKEQLIFDFVRMESFRRADNFEDYSLALYQQIEIIVNKICGMPGFINSINKLWDNTAYVDKNGGLHTIGNDVFGFDKGENQKYLSDGLKRAINNKLTAKDKLRIVIYFLGFWSEEYEEYNTTRKNKYWKKIGRLDFYNIIETIYLCRNTNHRSLEQNEIGRITENKISSSYFLFNWALKEFISIVNQNIEKLHLLADNSL